MAEDLITKEKEVKEGKPRFSFMELRQIFQNISIRVLKGAFQSFDFVTGVSGWFIGILSGQGYAEFQSGLFRGTFSIGGTTITIDNTVDVQDTIDAVSLAGFPVPLENPKIGIPL